MKIPADLLTRWKDLRSHGDGKKISTQADITEMDVSRAFSNGECSDDVFRAIADFYKEKEEILKEYIN